MSACFGYLPVSQSSPPGLNVLRVTNPSLGSTIFQSLVTFGLVVAVDSVKHQFPFGIPSSNS